MNNRVLEIAVGASRRGSVGRSFGRSSARRESVAMPANGPIPRLRLVTTREGAEDGTPYGRAASHVLEALLVSNLDLIEGVIRFVCQRHRLAASEAEEFAAEVKLRLVDHDYEILRRFQQRSSLRTYLTVVVQRLFLDYRNRLWGKWRPSAEARRLGATAMRLEMLLARDGISFDQACEILRTNEAIPQDRASLEAIATRLPVRQRRVRVGEEALEAHAQEAAPVDIELSADEHEATGRRIRRAVARAIQGLTDEDRLILRLRYHEDLGIVDIARGLHLEQKPLYRRFETLLRRLRHALEAEGIDRAQVRRLLELGDLDLGVATMSRSPDAVSRSLMETPGA